ncbi:GtrA family protein [Legionella impletisoli]|uniref:GtrA family protein n=1 Tax=Legionella impletisoli TaxID=343510 RepID=UPI001040F6B2|nr:GtrA family protein [Legionella impletisoli]
MKSSPLFITKLLGYIGVGGAAAFVDALAFYIAKYHLGLFYLWALVLGFIPGVTTNFLLCNALLFYKYKRSFFGAWYRHLVVSLFSLLINAVMMIILIEVLNINNYLCARIFALAFGFIISFVLIRNIAFQDNKYFKTLASSRIQSG